MAYRNRAKPKKKILPKLKFPPPDKAQVERFLTELDEFLRQYAAYSKTKQ